MGCGVWAIHAAVVRAFEPPEESWSGVDVECGEL